MLFECSTACTYRNVQDIGSPAEANDSEGFGLTILLEEYLQLKSHVIRFHNPFLGAGEGVEVDSLNPMGIVAEMPTINYQNENKMRTHEVPIIIIY